MNFYFIAPGDYKPEKIPVDKAPSYTFGVKPRIKERNFTPAPGQYSPKMFKKDSPKYSFGSKISQERQEETPGLMGFQTLIHLFD